MSEIVNDTVRRIRESFDQNELQAKISFEYEIRFQIERLDPIDFIHLNKTINQGKPNTYVNCRPSSNGEVIIKVFAISAELLAMESYAVGLYIGDKLAKRAF